MSCHVWKVLREHTGLAVVCGTLEEEHSREDHCSWKSSLVGELSVGGLSVSKQTSLKLQNTCWDSLGFVGFVVRVGSLSVSVLVVCCRGLFLPVPSVFQRKGRRCKNRPTFQEDLKTRRLAPSREPKLFQVSPTAASSGSHCKLRARGSPACDDRPVSFWLPVRGDLRLA